MGIEIEIINRNMEGTSLTPQQEKLKALQEILPEAFAEGKVDWEKLKATLGEDINFANERYVLNWAGKNDAFKVLQTPSTKTLIPCPEESVKADGTPYKKGETFFTNADSLPFGEGWGGANVFIEGENLEVLKVLQKSYFGKVKMIYIDPPYNTGNDSFIYPDKFSETLTEYKKRVGDIDIEGNATKDGLRKNSKENGQYHSNWLNMMMPRLYLAKNLLRQDGVIFVSIDDNEVHNLRLLMNEIFGEENFVEVFCWVKTSTPPALSYKSRKTVEYILCFEKIKNTRKYFGENLDGGDQPLLNEGNKLGILKLPKEKVKFNINDGKYLKGEYHRIKLLNDIEVINGFSINDIEIEGRFKWQQSFLNEEVKKNTTFIIKSDKFSIRFQRFEDESFKTPTNFIKESSYPILEKSEKQIDTNEQSSSQLEELLKGRFFDFPKPVSLIKYLINFCIQPNDLILDFFAGSGTTAHAVMELNKQDGGNRKYICVQLPELCDSKSEAYKAGYKTIADISKERIRRAGKKLKNEIEAQNEKFKNQIEFEKPKEHNLDLGFKVLKLADSNFKQWQQIEGKDAKALSEQMQLFIDPVAENATIENMVYEFLLKSGKDLNSTVQHFPSSGGVPNGRGGYFTINNTELILLLESVSQEIIERIINQKPIKVIALDKLFKDNDQLKTNTVLQMRDAGIEFKTV